MDPDAASTWQWLVIGLAVFSAIYGQSQAEKVRESNIRYGVRTTQLYQCMDALFDASNVVEQVEKAKLGNREDQEVLHQVMVKANEALHPPKGKDVIAYGNRYAGEDGHGWLRSKEAQPGSATPVAKKGSPRRKTRRVKGSSIG